MARLHDQKGTRMTRRYTITLTERELEDLLFVMPSIRPYSDVSGRATRLWNLRGEIIAQTRNGPTTIGGFRMEGGVYIEGSGDVREESTVWDGSDPLEDTGEIEEIELPLEPINWKEAKDA